MMDHKDLQEHLVDYLYDELDADAKAAFERALADDAEIQREVDAFRKTRQALEEMEDLEVPAAISEALIKEAARVDPAAERPVGFWQRLHDALRMMVAHPAMGAAAVMIAVIGVSFYVYRHGAPPTTPAEADRVNEALRYRPPPAPSGEASPSATAAPARAAQPPSPQAAEAPKDEAEAKTKGIAGGQGEAQGREEKARQRQAAAPDEAPARPWQEPARAVGGKKQLMQREQRLASTKPEPVKRGARRSARSYRPRARASFGERGNTLDDVSNVTTERRGRLASGPSAANRGAEPTTLKKLAPKPTKAPQAAPVARVRKKGKGRADKKEDTANTAPRWLALGREAAQAGHCSVAFDYFTRALSSDGSLAGAIASSLGRCRAQLTSKGPHVWLASRVEAAERRQVAQRKAAKRRRPAKAKSKNAMPTQLK